MSLTVNVSCHKCETEIDLETEATISCEFCDENMTSPGEVKGALLHSVSHNHLWDINETEMDISYMDRPEKRMAYFGGIKRGYVLALFWLSDYFGEDMVTFFEDEIEPKIRGKKEEDHEMV